MELPANMQAVVAASPASASRRVGAIGDSIFIQSQLVLPAQIKRLANGAVKLKTVRCFDIG
jgi:hypothetical protein